MKSAAIGRVFEFQLRSLHYVSTLSDTNNMSGFLKEHRGFQRIGFSGDHFLAHDGKLAGRSFALKPYASAIR